METRKRQAHEVDILVLDTDAVAAFQGPHYTERVVSAFESRGVPISAQGPTLTRMVLGAQ